MRVVGRVGKHGRADDYWRWKCPACHINEDCYDAAYTHDMARQHDRQCPALRLERLLHDMTKATRWLDSHWADDDGGSRAYAADLLRNLLARHRGAS